MFSGVNIIKNLLCVLGLIYKITCSFSRIMILEVIHMDIIENIEIDCTNWNNIL